MQGLTGKSYEHELKARRRATINGRRALVERLVPVSFNNWRNRTHEFDAVVTGHNPFLAAILVRQCLALGLDCLLTLERCSDPWPYDLAMHPSTVDFLASALGINPLRYGPRERFMTDFVNETIAPEASGLSVLADTQRLSFLDRQHPGEATLHVTGRADNGDPDPDGGAMEGVLRAAIRKARRVEIEKGKRGYVFTKRVILTGAASDFAPCVYSDGRLDYASSVIRPVGTAARMPGSPPEQAEMMVEDIVKCSRFEF
jgi:hypothetical protein